MNRQTTKIEEGIQFRKSVGWTLVPGYIGMTSNSVTGCPHGCRMRTTNGGWADCYAKVLAETRMAHRYPDGFAKVTFHPNVLETWRKTKEPCCIFCDSMSDLMSKEVKSEWLDATIGAMRECPQHIFQLLTKNPVRLSEVSFPENCWVGVSVPPGAMHGEELSLKQQTTMFRKWLGFLGKSDARVRFTSIEPLTWDCSEIIAECKGTLDWAIIGAASIGKEYFQPDENVFGRLLEALEGIPVFFKGNLDTRLAMRLGGWREEFPVIAKPVAEKEEVK